MNIFAHTHTRTYASFASKMCVQPSLSRPCGLNEHEEFVPCRSCCMAILGVLAVTVWEVNNNCEEQEQELPLLADDLASEEMCRNVLSPLLGLDYAISLDKTVMPAFQAAVQRLSSFAFERRLLFESSSSSPSLSLPSINSMLLSGLEFGSSGLEQKSLVRLSPDVVIPADLGLGELESLRRADRAIRHFFRAIETPFERDARVRQDKGKGRLEQHGIATSSSSIGGGNTAATTLLQRQRDAARGQGKSPSASASGWLRKPVVPSSSSPSGLFSSPPTSQSSPPLPPPSNMMAQHQEHRGNISAEGPLASQAGSSSPAAQRAMRIRSIIKTGLGKSAAPPFSSAPSSSPPTLPPLPPLAPMSRRGGTTTTTTTSSPSSSSVVEAVQNQQPSGARFVGLPLDSPSPIGEGSSRAPGGSSPSASSASRQAPTTTPAQSHSQWSTDKPNLKGNRLWFKK